MLQDVERLTNSEMNSMDPLKSVIRDIQIFFDALRLQCEYVLKTPLIWQALTKWHATGASVSIGLLWLLGFGWSLVLSTASLPLSIMSYNVSRFLGNNFMDAYDVYMYQWHELRYNLTSKSFCSMCVQTKVAKVRTISWSPVSWNSDPSYWWVRGWNHRISYLYRVVSDKFFPVHNSCYVV